MTRYRVTVHFHGMDAYIENFMWSAYEDDLHGLVLATYPNHAYFMSYSA